MNKRVTTVTAATAGAVLAATLAAVPALGADSSPAAPASVGAPLTDAQQHLVDEFLTDHPRFAQRLAHRAQVWHNFLAAHPDFAAEVDKVLALPAGQRRAELVSWLRDHPAVRHDLRQLRRELRQDRRDHRQDRRERRGATDSSATSFAV